MTPEQAAAYINSQVAVLNCRVAGMTAENEQRKILGDSVAYDAEHFFAVGREFEAVLGSTP